MTELARSATAAADGGGARSGYTLTELMLTVAVLGILFGIGPTLLVNLNNFFLMTTARNEIQRDARQSLDLINRFLRQAKYRTVRIDTPGGGGVYSRIFFEMADGRTIQFYQSGNKLIQQMGSNATTISSNLAYIAFTFPRTDDPTIVSVSITMNKSIQLGRRKVLELTIQKVRVMN